MFVKTGLFGALQLGFSLLQVLQEPLTTGQSRSPIMELQVPRGNTYEVPQERGDFHGGMGPPVGPPDKRGKNSTHASELYSRSRLRSAYNIPSIPRVQALAPSTHFPPS